MATIQIPNNWKPRPYQMPAWRELEGGVKRAVLVWHRRAGKDALSVNFTAVSALQKVGTYWHMAPTQRQVRKIVWDGIDKQGRRVIDQAFPEAIRARKNDTEMKIELVNGSIWQCVGSDNFDTLVGANPLGVVFSEWSLADPRAWDFVRPILAENGGWALFIYTPRGKNHGKDLLDMARVSDGWFAQVLTVEDTGAVSLDVINQERAELITQMGEADAETLLQQEWYCSFDALRQGAIYMREMNRAREELRIKRLPILQDVPVNTFWDMGWNDANAVWFHQYAALENRFLHSHQQSGLTLADRVSYLQAWAGEKGIVYGTHYLPHDADHKSEQTGKSDVELLRQLWPGQRFVIVPRTPSLYTAITGQCRPAFANCYFDINECADGISALEAYRWQWNERQKVYTDMPFHGPESNFADAFRQFAQGYAPKQQRIRTPDSPDPRERRHSRQSRGTWRSA